MVKEMSRNIKISAYSWVIFVALVFIQVSIGLFLEGEISIVGALFAIPIMTYIVSLPATLSIHSRGLRFKLFQVLLIVSLLVSVNVVFKTLGLISSLPIYDLALKAVSFIALLISAYYMIVVSKGSRQTNS